MVGRLGRVGVQRMLVVAIVVDAAYTLTFSLTALTWAWAHRDDLLTGSAPVA